jgi:O-antigen/teichoic acid export membrane protein
MQHIGRNIFSLVLSRVLSGVILFLIYTQLLRYLGPEAAGEFGLIGSYLTVFNFFVDLGMSQLVIKKMSEDATHLGKYLSNYFLIQLGLGVVFMLIMDGFIFFADYPGHVKQALYIAAIGLLLSSLSLPFRSVVVAMQRLTINARVNFLDALINAGMMGLAIIFRQNIFFLAFISVAISTFDILVYGAIVHKKFTAFKLNFDWSFAKQLFIWNIPFMLLTFFSIYNRIDGLILPHLRGFVENGYYAAAYKFWDILAYFPGVLGITLYPYFAHAISQGLKEQVRAGLETYSRYMIAVAVPMSVGTFLLAEQITREFFGSEFLPAAQALWLLVLAVSILFVYTPLNSLIISQLTKTATKITAFTFIFNITANLILIPKYGFVAAAAITAGSEFIQAIGYGYFIKHRVIDFDLFRHFIKPIAAALAMSLFIYFYKDHNLWLVIGLGGAIYAGVLSLLRFFLRSDWELFKTAINLKKSVTPVDTVNT